MGTRSLIGTTTDGITVRAVYCHWDGYPTSMVNDLARIITRDDHEAVKTLLATGWDSISSHTLRSDAELPYPTQREYLDATSREQWDPGILGLYRNLQEFGDNAHNRIVPGYGINSGTAQCVRDSGKLSTFRAGGWIEWVYVITADLSLLVHEVGVDGDLTLRETFTQDDLRAVVEGDETVSRRIGHAECGADYSRCTHYAWAHERNVPVESRNLCMAEWVGTMPISPNNAIAATIDGVRYEFTGGGSLHGRNWHMSIKGGGSVPVLRRSRSGKETLLPGVSLIYPPTKADVAAMFAN